MPLQAWVDTDMKNRCIGKTIKVSISKASVFLCLLTVLVLMSCGMPRPLFVGSESFTPSGTGNSYSGDMSIVYSNSVVAIEPSEERNGIMLFYTITNSVSDVRYTMRSIFYRELSGSSSSLGGAKNFSLDVGRYFANSSTTGQNLYPFTFSDSTGAAARSFKELDGYAVPLKNETVTNSGSNTTISRDFTIVVGQASGTLELSLEYSDQVITPLYLQNYAGNSFLKTAPSAQTNGYLDYVDRSNSNAALTTPVLHIYAAYFLNAQQGQGPDSYFTNHYWSELFQVATLDLSTI